MRLLASRDRFVGIAAVIGVILLGLAGVAASAVRLLPTILSLDVVARSADAIGIGVDRAVASALSDVIWLSIRRPVIVALGTGLVLIAVAAIRSALVARSVQAAAAEREQMRDYEAFEVELPKDMRPLPIKRIALAIVVLGILAGLAVFGPRLAGQGLFGGESEDDGPVVPVASDVLITQFVASNGSVGQDEDGDRSDWIELHNPSGEPVELAGHYLSDDDDEPDRWRLPDVTIDAGGYLLVWASGKDRDDPAGELHTDFSLDQNGEPLLLVAPDGETVIDRLEPVFLPRNIARGRDPTDGDRICYFVVPTPGEANVDECFDDLTLGAPRLSTTSGFYEQPFGLEIEVDDPNATIIYTLDGSYPDLDHNPDRTLIYDGPLRIVDRTPEPERLSRIEVTIPEGLGAFSTVPLPPFEASIDKSTVVRARSPYGAETVATYFVGPDMVRADLPVVSLVLDEEYLFDDEIGIYVPGNVFAEFLESDDYDPEMVVSQMPTNYNQRGRDWERPPMGQHHRAVVFEHCAPGGVCDYQRNVGLRIHGGATRAFHQKSLRLYARNDYGDRVFAYPFFSDRAPVGHRRLLMRNSGNDQGRTMIIDGYLQALMTHFRADTQAFQPVVVFINGEYWGIHNFRERYDQHYLELYYGADPDSVVMFEGGLAADTAGRELLEFVASSDPTSESTLARIEREMDLDSWIDFLVAHMFAGNPDWPGRNERMWRQPDGPDRVGEGFLDGRWRWQIVDLDQMGGRLGLYDETYDVLSDRFAPTADIDFEGGSPALFTWLMDNDEVRQRFIVRFADHLNTSFDPDRASRVLTETVEAIEDEMPRHEARYPLFDDIDWRDQLEQLDTFMQLRPDAVRGHIATRFGLAGQMTLDVATDPDGGFVRVNTIAIDGTTPGVADPANWQGTYFIGVPLRIEAVPWAGHEFVRWEGPSADLAGIDATNPVIEFEPDDDMDLIAVFASS
ncbi:MAG: CotH kinase family protein [Nitriliruptoraceae bacterium]